MFNSTEFDDNISCSSEVDSLSIGSLIENSELILTISEKYFGEDQYPSI